MQFFEKPKMVTAVVFFIQTILALLNMEHFLYMNFFQLVLAGSAFIVFPFVFHFIYVFIMTDLDTADKELVELKKIPFKLKEQEEKTEKTMNLSKQEDHEAKPMEPVVDEVPEESVTELPIANQEIESIPVTESDQDKEALVDKKKKSSPTPSRMARKQIQVVDLNEEFVDDEMEEVEEQTPLTKPIVVKKAKPYRLNRKLEASTRSSSLPSDETATE